LLVASFALLERARLGATVMTASLRAAGIARAALPAAVALPLGALFGALAAKRALPGRSAPALLALLLPPLWLPTVSAISALRTASPPLSLPRSLLALASLLLLLAFALHSFRIGASLCRPTSPPSLNCALLLARLLAAGTAAAISVLALLCVSTPNGLLAPSGLPSPDKRLHPATLATLLLGLSAKLLLTAVTTADALVAGTVAERALSVDPWQADAEKCEPGRGDGAVREPERPGAGVADAEALEELHLLLHTGEFSSGAQSSGANFGATALH